MRVHIGAIWRIRLNRPCAAAMRRFCQITLSIVTFRVSHDDANIILWSRASVCVCVCVCVFVRGRMPTLLHGPGCNLGEW